MPAAVLTEDDIREALRDCYDPAIPCNIVDLGMVEAIRVAADPHAPGAGIAGVPERHRVEVDLLSANATDDGARAGMRAQVENRLAGIEAVSRATVRVLEEPAWTPLRITPAGRRILGLEGNPHLVQITAGRQD